MSEEQFQRLSGMSNEEQRVRLIELFDQDYTAPQAFRVLLRLPLPDDLDAKGWPLLESPGGYRYPAAAFSFDRQMADLHAEIARSAPDAIDQLSELEQDGRALQRGDFDAVRPETLDPLLWEAELRLAQRPWWRRMWFRMWHR